MNIGGNIVKLRGNMNISQAKLAKKSQVPQSTLSDIERNINSPNIKTLLKLADAMGCTLNDIIEIEIV